MALKIKPSVAVFGIQPLRKTIERRRQWEEALRRLPLALAQGDTLTPDLFRHATEQIPPTNIQNRDRLKVGSWFEQLRFDFSVLGVGEYIK